MTNDFQFNFGENQRVVEEMYRHWKADPQTVTPEWRTFFERFQDRFAKSDFSKDVVEVGDEANAESGSRADSSNSVTAPAPAEASERLLEAPTDDESRVPVVVVDGVDVIYQVYASGKKANRYNGGASKKSGRNQLRQVHAVKNVSFTVYKGETIGIIGTNGSGKSSLLRAVAGLTQPSKGAVYASARPVLLGVGGVLMPALSGEKNIFLGGLAMGYSRKDSEELAPAITAFAGLEEFIDLPMRTYSSGMSARLRFAIASSRSHDIMIIDEALSVGDQQFRKRSEARMREMRENAGTVFLVSHSMTSILDTCSRVIWLEKGVLRMDGDPKEVCAAYNEYTGVKTIDD